MVGGSGQLSPAGLSKGALANRGLLGEGQDASLRLGQSDREGGEMTLDEAIKELTKAYNYPMNCINVELHDATKLGIEALKRLIDNRRDPEFDHWVPLPGETEAKR